MNEHTHVFEPIDGFAVKCDCGLWLGGQDLIDAVQVSFEAAELKRKLAEVEGERGALLDELESLCSASAHCGESGWLGEHDPWENARTLIAKHRSERKLK